MITAIRALPGNSITGHSPEIFQHAVLADTESAPASPVKRCLRPAAVAAALPGLAAFFPVFRSGCNVCHVLIYFALEKTRYDGMGQRQMDRPWSFVSKNAKPLLGKPKPDLLSPDVYYISL